MHCKHSDGVCVSCVCMCCVRACISGFKFCLYSGKFRGVVNAADGNDKTPLHLAIEHGYFSRVEMLLECGAGSL